MKVSRGASQTLQQAQAQSESKSLKSKNKMNSEKAQGASSPLSAQVSLSKRAQQIKQATDLAKKDGVDEKKVARLQSLIDSGKYQMDSAKIADKLVDEHLKMPT